MTALTILSAGFGQGTVATAATAAIVLLALASLWPLRRIITGPSLADRSIGLDVLLANAVAVMALFSIVRETDRYLPMILLIILLGFTSSVAFARFLETGQVFESESSGDDTRQKPSEDSIR